MSGTENSNKKLKIFAIVMTILAAVFLAAFLVAFFDPGTVKKVRLRLGIEQEEYWTDARKAVTSWENMLEKLDIDADVVFFGDSLTKNSDFREYFPDLTIVNLGLNGDKISSMRERVNMIAAVSPEKVFILGGVNELRDDNIDGCLADYAALLDSIKAAVPGAQICVQSILPISLEIQDSVGEHDETIRKFNEAIQQLASERGLDFADIYPLYVKDGEMDPQYSSDGIHITDEAYTMWADRIRELVYKGIPESGDTEEAKVPTVEDAVNLLFNATVEKDRTDLNAGDITNGARPDDRSIVFHAWEGCLAKLDYDADIVFYGDSLILRSDFRRYFPDRKIVNLGCGGDTILGAIQRAEMTAIPKPEKIFIMCGVNELRNGNTDKCISDYALLLDSIREANAPDTQVYVLSVLPMVAWMQEYLPCSRETTVEFNSALKELAKEYKMTYIDLFPLYEKDGQMDPDLSFDGIHLEKTHGYDPWAEAIKEYIYN